MKAMIFAAGLGTRLKPLTDTMPKALVPLAGKPLLAWQVEKLRDAGITDIIVMLSEGMTLKAGTVIATGTPAGVGMGMKPPTFLKPGDVVECEIEGIGVLRNYIEG